MNEFIFDNDFIKKIKKNVINYISRANVNINKITYNLSLYTKFIIDGNDTNISVILPKLSHNQIIPATIKIGKEYFHIKDNTYYIKEKYEDALTIKLTRILVKAASIKINYNNVAPIGIDSIGLETINGNGFDVALNAVISEDVNGYIIPDFDDPYAFNKGIVKMIMAIIGSKCVVNSYFNHDKGLFVSLYSLSVDNNLFIKINDKLTAIMYLINTLNSTKADMNDVQKEIIKKTIRLKEEQTMNLIFNKLYIPYINSVPLDRRRQVRDDILKGFLGINYTNLKLSDENKNNYYWASMVNNTISINNKITEQAWAYFREEASNKETEDLKKIRAMIALNKAKNNIKEFIVINEGNKIKINNGKKIITDKNEVLEMLSYAYISSIDNDLKSKIENGIIKLCENKTIFTSSLKGNPLSNRMLTSAIIKLADKNGYKVNLVSITDDLATFEVKRA